jgi:hypothetical protein
MTKSVPPSDAAPADERTVIVRRDRRFRLAPGTLLGSTPTGSTRCWRGGMGEVGRATHLELATTHAIKVILPSLAKSSCRAGRTTRRSSKCSSPRHLNYWPSIGTKAGFP